MKQTRPILNCELLKFIRDVAPTTDQLIAWFGTDCGASRFHILRKSGLIQIEGGCVKLSAGHLSEDGKSFLHENLLFMIDENITRILVRRRRV